MITKSDYKRRGIFFCWCHQICLIFSFFHLNQIFTIWLFPDGWNSKFCLYVTICGSRQNFESHPVIKLKQVVSVLHVDLNRYNLASVLTCRTTAFVHVCVHICEVPMQTYSKDGALVWKYESKRLIEVWLKRLHLFLKASFLHTTAAVFVFRGAEADVWGHTLAFCSSHWLVKTETPRAMPVTTGRQSDANSFTNTTAHIPRTHTPPYR